jgi:hypothetical protein
VQAAILKKVLAYDRALSTRRNVKFLLVGAEANPGVADELSDAFKEMGIPADRARSDELTRKVDDATVVYMMTVIGANAVKRTCRERSVLSVSGFPGFAERGDVSVAIGLREDGKPQIIVNVGQLKSEGHELSAELLSLSRIVR